MSFTIIPGGLLDDESPAPDKPIEEWTAEEHEAYSSYWYENAEPGTADYALKHLSISSEAIRTTIQTLETFRSACSAEAEAAGYKTEWNHLSGDNIIGLFKQRLRSDPCAVIVSTPDTIWK